MLHFSTLFLLPLAPLPQMLGAILDRGHLINGKPRPYADTGVGYEVVNQMDGAGLLKGVQ
jgi:hypothetical protein